MRNTDVPSQDLRRAYPNYATTINNLAGTYRLQKDYFRAESLFLEAMSIYARTLGKEHFLYASSLNNLGLLYQDLNNWEKAEPLHREAQQLALKIGRVVFEHVRREQNSEADRLANKAMDEAAAAPPPRRGQRAFEW